MNKKKAIASIIYIVGIVVIMGIYTMAYNAVCFVETPNVVGITVSEAIKKLEKAEIETTEHKHMYIISKEGTTLAVLDEEKYQNSTVIKQKPSAGEKFKIQDGLLKSKSQKLDIMTLEIKQETNT